MKKIVFFFFPVFLLYSCAKDTVQEQIPLEIKEVPAISITAGRTEGNIVLSESMAESAGTKSAPGNDIFDRDIEVDCYETVILPSDVSHIWVGNVVKKYSIADHQFTPLSGQKSPITFSSSLYGVMPREINRPSNTAYLSYVNSVIDSGIFSQYGEFDYCVEQFSSYNEIKKALGSNSNTDILFFSSGTSETTSTHTIQRATGVYLKFYQTNFRVFMDDPGDYIPTACFSDKESSAYVNSVAFGRLGILAMETNYSAEEAITQVNKIVNKLFIKGSKNYTSEEKAFLNSCEFRLMMIGGEGQSDVTCFEGLDEFIANVRKGTFSREHPGVPILCTFNNLSDNSPFNIRFSIKYEKEPIFAELVTHNNRSTDFRGGRRTHYLGDLYVHFYRNRFGTPTIAPKNVEFVIEEEEEVIENNNLASSYKTTRTYGIRNTAGETEVLWRAKAPGYIYYNFSNDYPFRIQGIRERRPLEGGEQLYYTYRLMPSDDYFVIGFPISGATDTQNQY